jgi:hypothetical protein
VKIGFLSEFRYWEGQWSAHVVITHQDNGDSGLQPKNQVFERDSGNWLWDQKHLRVAFDGDLSI